MTDIVSLQDHKTAKSHQAEAATVVKGLTKSLDIIILAIDNGSEIKKAYEFQTEPTSETLSSLEISEHPDFQEFKVILSNYPISFNLEPCTNADNEPVWIGTFTYEGEQ